MRAAVRIVVGAACVVSGALLLARILPVALPLLAVGIFLMISLRQEA